MSDDAAMLRYADMEEFQELERDDGWTALAVDCRTWENILSWIEEKIGQCRPLHTSFTPVPAPLSASAPVIFITRVLQSMTSNSGDDKSWRDSRVVKSPPPVDIDEDDMEELKQIVLEVLSKYESLYEKRIQKIIFYGEIYTAQRTGQRLTDSSFVPYDYGPYSRAIREALDELVEEGKISQTPIGQYQTGIDGGDLVPKKKYLLDQVHEDTKRMSTDEIVDRVKASWLWENFEYAEEMDFATYIDEILISPGIRHYVEGLESEPVEDANVEHLFSD